MMIKRALRYPLLALQKMGAFRMLDLHVMPIHYYSSLPEFEDVQNNPVWDSRPKSMYGIDLNEAEQLRFLRDECPHYTHEFDRPLQQRAGNNKNEFYFDNHMFANTDAEVYYCMIRHFKPKTIIEIGAGRSTQVCAAAVKRNHELHGVNASVRAIEPCPSDLLRNMQGESIELIACKVQKLGYEYFNLLTRNDILFIDSSHIVKSGGDVNYLFLEVLPQLDRGVVVHVHDIRLPYEVMKSTILSGPYFNEQYLLQALLINNRDYEVLWGTHYMSMKHKDEVGSVFRSSNGGTYKGSSFWIRRRDA